MAIYKVLFEKLYTINPIDQKGTKKVPSLKYILHILHWWHLAYLPK